jgi:hypothetical protein
MLSLCFYAVMYVLATFGVSVFFGGYILYNYCKSRIAVATKFSALHLVSMAVIGIGFLFSELYIGYNDLYACSEKESVSSTIMLLAIIVTVIVSKKHKHKKYVYNFRINRWLAFADMFLLASIILMLAFAILG